MNQKFENCLNRKQIVKDPAARSLAQKEFETAKKDLESSEKSLNSGDPKWSIVQSYYAAFHAFRTLLYNMGFRERSHYCLIQAIEALFVDEGKIEPGILKKFEKMKTLREKADYATEFSDDGALFAIGVAKIIVEQTFVLLNS